MTGSLTQKPQVGQVTQLIPGLQVVLAPNASPMTYWGTNTYILGDGKVAVIDPGPEDPAHFASLRAALSGRTVTHIIVTHSHLDHSPLARRLGAETGAPVIAFGDNQAGRSAVMRHLAENGFSGGGEGVDHDFAPDILVREDDVIDGAGWRLGVQHMPGHMGNHICLQWENSIFSGDLVMGWASSLVSPPDGDVTDFLSSCRRLLSYDPDRLFCGHGPTVEDPKARIAWLLAHRRSREDEILHCLATGLKTVPQIARAIYADLSNNLLQAAERNVFAHLVDLNERGLVKAEPQLSFDAEFCK